MSRFAFYKNLSEFMEKRLVYQEAEPGLGDAVIGLANAGLEAVKLVTDTAKMAISGLSAGAVYAKNGAEIAWELATRPDPPEHLPLFYDLPLPFEEPDESEYVTNESKSIALKAAKLHQRYAALALRSSYTRELIQPALNQVEAVSARLEEIYRNQATYSGKIEDLEEKKHHAEQALKRVSVLANPSGGSAFEYDLREELAEVNSELTVLRRLTSVVVDWPTITEIDEEFPPGNIDDKVESKIVVDPNNSSDLDLEVYYKFLMKEYLPRHLAATEKYAEQMKAQGYYRDKAIEALYVVINDDKASLAETVVAKMNKGKLVKYMDKVNADYEAYASGDKVPGDPMDKKKETKKSYWENFIDNH